MDPELLTKLAEIASVNAEPIIRAYTNHAIVGGFIGTVVFGGFAILIARYFNFTVKHDEVGTFCIRATTRIIFFFLLVLAAMDLVQLLTPQAEAYTKLIKQLRG